MSQNDRPPAEFVSAGWKSVYRIAGLSFGIIFATVGVVFLVCPASVVLFFNSVAGRWGMRESPPPEASLYIALAAAYMYVVTVLALGMYFRPGEKLYPVLLVQAKSASAVLSLMLCIVAGAQLILVSNTIVDAVIALAVAYIGYRGRKRPG